MARRARPADNEVSLFPFLSIIACVIGVLTMMIATLALAQTSNPDVAQIEAYEAAEKKLRDVNQQIERLNQEMEASQTNIVQIRQQQQVRQDNAIELQSLQDELSAVEAELAKQAEIKIVIPPIDQAKRETAAEMQAQYDHLQQELAILEQAVAQQSDAKEALLTVTPQGSGIQFTPHFVECSDGAVTLHNLSEPKRIRAADVARDDDFIKLLETVANRANDTIIFLIRDDGLGSYEVCRRLCDERGLRNGRIPLVGKGRVDLSAFQRGKQVQVKP